jgi:hypothetical protein
MIVTLAKDLRALFGEVRDQAVRPTCLACAVSDAHAAVYKPLHPLSLEYLFYHGVQRMHARDPKCGISMEAASHVLPNDGQPVEADWPYLDVLPADLSTWKPPANCMVYRRALPRDKLNVEQMCAVMDGGLPVVVVLGVTESFFSPNASGVVVEPLVDPVKGNPPFLSS